VNSSAVQGRERGTWRSAKPNRDKEFSVAEKGQIKRSRQRKKYRTRENRGSEDEEVEEEEGRGAEREEEVQRARK